MTPPAYLTVIFSLCFLVCPLESGQNLYQIRYRSILSGSEDKETCTAERRHQHWAEAEAYFVWVMDFLCSKSGTGGLERLVSHACVVEEDEVGSAINQAIRYRNDDCNDSTLTL